MKYPRVMTELETVYLLKEGHSIARYGDGEIKLMQGNKCVSQEYDEHLAERLRAILTAKNDNCLIGIPRLVPIEIIAESKRDFWSKYTLPPQTRYYDFDKVYASSFISRPDNVLAIRNNKYFNAVKEIWRGKDVVLVNGSDEKCKFDKDESLLKFAASVDRMTFAPQHAWKDYQEILDYCKQLPKSKLFIIALGPTATVLAYDLSMAGYQALDLGHLGRLYAGFQEENQK